MSRPQRIIYSNAYYHVQELADRFGLQHYGGISYAVHAFAQELRKDLELDQRVGSVVEKLVIEMC